MLGKATQLEPNIMGISRDFKRDRYQKLAFVEIYISIYLYRDRRFFSKTVSLISQLLNKIERRSTTGFEGQEICRRVGGMRICLDVHVGCDVT